MTMRARILGSMHVGIALAPDRLVAVLPGSKSGDPWVRTLASVPGTSVASPDLAAALAELRDLLREASHGRERRVTLHCALLPPLMHWRRIAMPGLRIDEARQVLRREPSRYLPIAADSAPMEIELEGTGSRHRSPFAMVAAPRALVEEIHVAAEASGLHVAEIVSAHAAWAASATARWPSRHPRARALRIELGDRIDVVTSRGGRVTDVRRVPAELRSLLPELVPPAEAPEALAARFAPRAAGPALLPEHARAAAERRSKTVAIERLATAAALLIAAGALELRGSARERSMIAGERARLRGAVAEALETREKVEQAAHRLATLRSAAESAPRWSMLLAALSESLPDDAFLVALSGSPDSLQLEGVASRAAPVFDAIGRIDGVGSVRPEGPIRQERSVAGATMERFTLAASMGRKP